MKQPGVLEFKAEDLGGRVEAILPAVLVVGLSDAAMQRSDARVTRCDTSVEALDLLRQARFDLVLVDAKLRDCSPIALARTVRRYWPRQRWVLIGAVNFATEFFARSLGACAVVSEEVEVN